MGGILEAVVSRGAEVSAPSPEPIETAPRMTAGAVIVALSNMGKSLECLAHAYGKLPESTSRTLPELLAEIARNAQAIIATSERLNAVKPITRR